MPIDGDTDVSRIAAESPSQGVTLAGLGHWTLRQGGTSQRIPKHKSSYSATHNLAVVTGVVRKLRAGEKFTIKKARKSKSASQV